MIRLLEILHAKNTTQTVIIMDEYEILKGEQLHDHYIKNSQSLRKSGAA